MLSAYLGDTASDLQAQVTYLSSQLAAIGVAAQQARARGDQADLENIMQLYRNVAGQINILNSQVPTGMPSSFMLALADLGDQAQAVGKQVLGAAGDVVGATGTLAKVLPVALLGLLVVLGIGVYKGSLSASVRR